MSFAIVAILAGFAASTVPATANDVRRVAEPILTAEKDVPTGPRICLFSQSGKRAESAAADSAEQIEPASDAQPNTDTPVEAARSVELEIAQRSPEDAPMPDAVQQAPASQNAKRVCDTDVKTNPAPHG